MSIFREAVLSVVGGIPAGQTLTYQAVADLAGYPRAYRAVGNLLKTNFDPAIPCHRVICADGRLGAYNRGAQAKRVLLIAEGAQIG